MIVKVCELGGGGGHVVQQLFPFGYPLASPRTPDKKKTKKKGKLLLYSIARLMILFII